MQQPADLAPAPRRTMGFTEIKEWLRHRHPMLYLDRVLDYEPGACLTSSMFVSGNMDAVAGHFPERAIFPASHLTQAFAQSGIILYQLSTSRLTDDELTLIGSMKSRFTRIVVPGDQVIFEVRSDRIQDTTFFFSGRATVEGRPVAVLKGTLVRVKVADLGEQLW
ncbi:3-hydroxyacyl-ACP dehydratase FabZ family protein [Nonomuraea lactucae]|uniref:3-hydroxyacyl-ACP dehydratase FabZ family protein n=1 Tax=Nonomuraea lactucae TaxID=2249762 RepID=UPI000DE4D15D|nr:beta-hydroxyacyl-ACP dehydratase [Nonomuraea lactucae]